MIKSLVFLIICTGVYWLNAADTDQQKVYIFYTNDLQGRINQQEATYMNPQFPPQLGGFASSYPIIESYRQKADQDGDIVLLLDGGDFIHGSSPLGEASGGQTIIDAMNYLRYDAIVPGSNDFNLGSQQLKKLAQTAQFPLLACNIFNLQSSQYYLKPFTIISKRGVNFGVLGVTSKSAEQNDDSTKVNDLQFKSEIESARGTVEQLKEENADIIIALAHLGLPYDAEDGYKTLKELEKQNIQKSAYVNTMDFANHVKNIDVIISGQMHRGYQEPWVDPVTHAICVQNYANGGNLGLLILKLNRKTKSIIGYELPSRDGGLLLLSKDEYWPDEEVKNEVDRITNTYLPDYDKPIGTTIQTLKRNSYNQSALSNLMCDAMVEHGPTDFAFNNFTSMRADLHIGPITQRDISNMLPFGNELVLIKMKGSLLFELMQGSISKFSSGFAIGGGRIQSEANKIYSFKINGIPLNPDKIYHVATSAYLAAGNYGLTKLAFLPKDRFIYTGKKIRTCVIDYIIKRKELDIIEDGRWERK